MNELRVGVIGAGLMGETHLRSYAAIPGVRIVGLATRTPERAAQLAKIFPIEATFGDARELIDQTKPDGVSVTTAEHDHVLPTQYALERNVGVLLEKPIASNVHDAELIAEAAERSGAVLVPAHILRFTLPYRALREEVVSGRIGTVVGIAARRDRNRKIAEHYGHVHPAFLTAVHDIDLMLWITGAKVSSVRALEHAQSVRENPDLIWALAKFESGVIATISTAYLHPADGPVATSDRFEVYGTAGVGTVDLSVPLLSINTTPTLIPDWLLAPSDGSGAFGAEIAHFCDCLRAGRASDVVSVHEAVEGIRVADAMVRSASAGGQEVAL